MGISEKFLPEPYKQNKDDYKNSPDRFLKPDENRIIKINCPAIMVDKFCVKPTTAAFPGFNFSKTYTVKVLHKNGKKKLVDFDIQYKHNTIGEVIPKSYKIPGNVIYIYEGYFCSVKVRRDEKSHGEVFYNKTDFRLYIITITDEYTESTEDLAPLQLPH